MNKSRILIVDDEPVFIRLLKIVLENTGRYSVQEENDATRVVEVARTFQPDLVLLDFVMPKLDGGSVAHELKSDPQFRDTPVLFLSATVVEKNGYPARIAGFPAYAKPIGLSELVEAIDESLAPPDEFEALNKESSLFSSPGRALHGMKGAGGSM